MSLDWEVLDELGRRHAFGKVADVLVTATEPERLAFGAQIESRATAERTEFWTRFGRDPAPMHVLATLACMPTPARATALLCRREMRGAWGQAAYDSDAVLRIVRARDLPWWDELACRLAERLPESGAGWPLVSVLLRETGAVPPVTEGVVRGWLRELGRPRIGSRPAPLSVRMRDDPFLDLLTPAVFDIDGLGDALADGPWDETDRTTAFPIAVAELVTAGRLDRGRIAAATVDRLVRGDRPARLRPFAVLHESLALTADERAGHVHDYARMLAGAPSPIAGMAQGVLRTLDDAGRLDLRTLLEASRPTLERSEKSLVRTQLAWLDKVARRDPENAGAVLETMTAAFGNPALDLRDRALTLIGRQAGRLPAATRERLAEASRVLTGDLAARAATLLGTAPQPAPAPVPARLPAPWSAAPMPPPIGDPAELAGEVVTLLRHPSGPRWERVLAAMVTLHATGEHDGLAAAITPVLARYGQLSFIAETRPAAAGFLGPALQAVMRRDRDDHAWRRMVAFDRAARDGDPVFPDSADGVLSLRLAEIAMNVSTDPVPVLVCTPTHVDGSLAADVLLERLVRAEAEGWQPWPLDFEQALLRLPRGVGAGVRAGAARLTTPAGRRFADRIAAGPPEPISTRFEQRASPVPDRPGYGPCPVPRRVVANLRPARTDGLFLETALFTLTRRPSPTYLRVDHGLGPETGILAMALPHHREVTAAWALPDLARLADQDAHGGAELLPVLAECAGPIGPAMSAALAYALGARHESDRVAAVDAFVALAARDEPFAAAVGADLGDLGADGMLKLSRVVAALRDAHLAGASAQVWESLAAALVPLLPAAPRGLPELLMLGAQVAEEVGVAGDIPGLAEVAGRAGGTRLVQEARRLRSVLCR
ncbi:DUF6493 family protein [Actinoplanes sp. NPDC049802]|uniref:DUF6493 family protein n=1 Tax=Actinoplanes sp. NPDC049802 TaxID=3154742 RepID=UPI0033F8FAAE